MPGEPANAYSQMLLGLVIQDILALDVDTDIAQSINDL
jgi:hypothetical protein